MLINPLRLRSMLMGLDLEQQALAGGGNRTRFRASDSTDTSDTEPAQNCANSRQSNTLPDSASSSREQKPTLSRHTQDTSAHQKYVPSMYKDLPQDLAEVVEG